jgi:hypothetical protein
MTRLSDRNLLEGTKQPDTTTGEFRLAMSNLQQFIADLLGAEASGTPDDQISVYNNSFGDSGNWNSPHVGLSASRSNPIYGASDTVCPLPSPSVIASNTEKYITPSATVCERDRHSQIIPVQNERPASPCLRHEKVTETVFPVSQP